MEKGMFDLDQEKIHVEYCYILYVYQGWQVCLTNRPQFSMVYILIDHIEMMSWNVQNSSGTTSRRLVVSMQSFEHFIASFLQSVRVQTMETCGWFVFYNNTYI